jgi:hypothetical protein
MRLDPDASRNTKPLRVVERTFDKVRQCGPARPGHGGGGVAIVNRSMACGARCIADVFEVSRPLTGPGGLGPRRQREEQYDWRESSTGRVIHRSRLFHSVRLRTNMRGVPLRGSRVRYPGRKAVTVETRGVALSERTGSSRGRTAILPGKAGVARTLADTPMVVNLGPLFNVSVSNP